ncbi:MAG: class IV adenylate cyclase [Chitinophagaceae bacterium]|nr:class IV adenylate cyclase [Chitinophagaceae bacterium]MBL0056949.1 class IV adenylate cyclase [Chitinophagaceae bacterium]
MNATTHLNIEFKAKAADLNLLENKLLALGPVFTGEDRQIDTYFNTEKGRLKLREGNIENALIWYQRENIPGIKQSDVLLYPHQPHKSLKDMLTLLHGVKVVVDKTRRIYFLGNVKFHFDRVAGLGTFVEVEAIDRDGTIGREILQEQADGFAALFEIRPEDFVAVSYSDLLLGVPL